MEPDFSGYVSKAGLKCADGRTIAHGAFSGMDGKTVTVVYQHNHDDIKQVLGKATLTAKPEGTWGDVYLNGSDNAKAAREAVQHGDLNKFSVWAKDLDQRFQGNDVIVHDGIIQEVSLCIAGKNSGALVQNVLMHDDLDDDTNIFVVTGEIRHADDTPIEKPEDKPAEVPPVEKPEEGEKTVADVLGTLNEDQQKAVNSFVDDVVKEATTEALTKAAELTHDNLDKDGNPMKTGNIFDRDKQTTAPNELKHDDMAAVLIAAKGNPSEGIGGFNHGSSGSLKELVRSDAGKELMHADTYGVQNMEVLFPDAQALMNTPKFVDRRQDWVKKFMAGTSHSPFSRVKTMYADITADEARARGYIKAGQKVEEVFPIFKRVTGPTMIYKLQKLDRQDILEITSFDIVAWMKVEMRGKLDEEIARAALFGDGRPTMIGGNMNPDKIPSPTGESGDGLRAIVLDDDLYATTYPIALPANPVNEEWNVVLDTVTEAGEFYLGSGHKTAFMGYGQATKLLTIRDGFGKRMYRNLAEVAGDMDVAEIVRVPSELMPTDVICVVLDLADYNFGTNAGGNITLFDDFDIKFNQYLYLIETYLSGALVIPYAAQIFKRVLAGSVTEVIPTMPVVAANVVTIPTQTGVIYKRDDTGATVAGGSTITLNNTTLKSVKIEAFPASSSYIFESNDDRKDSKTFNYKA